MEKPATFELMQLPVELIHAVFSEYIKSNCPNLFIVKKFGTIPEGSEGHRYNKGSDLIDVTLKKEEKLVRSLLRVSKLIYHIALEYLLGPSVYFVGFSGLKLQQRRHKMLNSLGYPAMLRARPHPMRPNPKFTCLRWIQTLVVGSGPLELECDLFPNADQSITRLMHTILRALGKDSRLRRLVLSGDFLRSPFWVMPTEIGNASPLDRLTHLTLSLPASMSQGKVLRDEHSLKIPSDIHLCVLLTRRSWGPDGRIKAEVPFLGTLKYLHVRGLGAHICGEFFKSNEGALETVIIEMGNFAGICDGSLYGLMHNAKETASRKPEMSISIHCCWDSKLSGQCTAMQIFKKTPGAWKADGSRNHPVLLRDPLRQPINYVTQLIRSQTAETLRAWNRRVAAMRHSKTWNMAEEASKLAADPMEEDPLEFDEDLTELRRAVDDQWDEYLSDIPFILC